MNWHRIEEHYFLDRERAVFLTASELCNRLIHSYIFMEVMGTKSAVEGFFFASDKSKRNALWYVKLSDFISLLKETGRDYPSSSRRVRDPRSGEWIVWSGHGHPPDAWEAFAARLLAKYVTKLTEKNSSEKPTRGKN